MKTASPFPIALAAAFVLAVSLSAAGAQQPAEPEHHSHGPMPPPSNLQVLPKTLTADQVHEIMHGWAHALGTECTTCHAADPTKVGPNGRPRLNFADDSKPEKTTARLMVKMVEEINSQYIGKIDSDGAKVTCGTCHRGHLMPEPFVPPPDEDHDHPAPPPSK
ncbi:MAG TPA: c-type cytochrome [Terracidiphilus sp.]|nr:c-type cytochrome [Terracidiphilus sp.]